MTTYDAVIAGGGVIGACSALELAEAGLKVALYDAREPGQEASWASAGMISPAPENPQMIPFVPFIAASVALYPKLIQKVQERTGIDVGYHKTGSLDLILDGDVPQQVDAIVALQHGAGLHADALSAAQAREMVPSLTNQLQAAVFRADEASLDARVFTRAVLEAARRAGVDVFAGNGAQALRKEKGRCRGLILQNGEMEAKWTIVAAGCFSSQIAGVEPFAPVIPAKGQILALRCEAVKLSRILWLGHKYLVPRTDGRIIAGATIEHAGFDRAVTAGGMRSILSEAVKMVPELEKAHIEDSWAGLRPDSPDHLPIVGPTDVEGLLIATGHFRSGVLMAPITARLIREWVTTQQVTVNWDNMSPMRFGRKLSVSGRTVTNL
jgi:glycine oxidase